MDQIANALFFLMMGQGWLKLAIMLFNLPQQANFQDFKLPPFLLKKLSFRINSSFEKSSWEL